MKCMIEKVFLIFAESALEIVPMEIWNHPAIVSSAKKRKKKPSEILLDRSYHHNAMKNLKESYKRGRPDIIHFCLLEALGSILCKIKKLEVYVHTIDDYVIYVNPETRLPRVYNRFLGLIEQLYNIKEIKANDKILLKIEKKNLSQIINEIKPDKIFGMDEKGYFISPKKFSEIVLECSKPAIIIGAFPKGEYSNNTKSIIGENIYSIYPESLETWIITSRILSALENEVYYKN
ncbi:MAG: 16S rRNA methyltransferase [Nitrososphaerota archaeon]